MLFFGTASPPVVAYRQSEYSIDHDLRQAEPALDTQPVLMKSRLHRDCAAIDFFSPRRRLQPHGVSFFLFRYKRRADLRGSSTKLIPSFFSQHIYNLRGLNGSCLRQFAQLFLLDRQQQYAGNSVLSQAVPQPVAPSFTQCFGQNTHLPLPPWQVMAQEASLLHASEELHKKMCLYYVNERYNS